MAADDKPISLVTTSGTLVRGQHVDAGTVLMDMPAEEALIYLQAGRARRATEKDIAEAEAAEKAAAEAPPAS